MGVRILFRDSIKFIADSVKSQNLTDQPYLYFLKLMLSEVRITENKPKESKQFFQLLNHLLHKYFDAKKSGAGS